MFSVKTVILNDLQQLALNYCDKHLVVFAQKLEDKLGRKASAHGMNANRLRNDFARNFLMLVQAFLQHRNDAGHLPPEARILDGKLGLYNMAIDCEQNCHRELHAFNQRLSVMCQFRVNSAQNPFSPVAFASALEQTVAQFGWELHTRLVAFKLFNSEFLLPLDAFYRDANIKLVDYGILSNLRPEDAASERLRANLHKAQISFLSAQHAPDSEDFALSSQGEQTLEAVNKLFNQLLSDHNDHADIRTVVGRLYPSYVAIALSDQDFLHSNTHPAQRLLQHLRQAADVFSEADSLQRPVVKQTLDSLVERLGKRQTPDQQTLEDATFRFNNELRHTQRIQRWQRQQKQRGETALKDIKRFKNNIVSIVDHRIAHHDREVPSSINLFLAHTWANYITSEFLNGNARHGESIPALELIEPILQYAAPSSAEGEADFTQIAPHIRNSLLASGSAELEVRQFLQRLMQYHKASPTYALAHQKGLAL